MNNFEIKFFKKYIPEWEEIKWVIHKHFTEVFWMLVFWMSLVFFPSFLYYYSWMIHDIIPFFILEIYLMLIYIKLIYNIFDWYNDVWIITNVWLIDLQWSLFKKNINSVNFKNIEWIEVNQSWFIDSILKRWDLIVHKIWDDTFFLKHVYKPFNHVNLIEEISSEIDAEEDETSITEKRFDMIINTLWNMMEWYLGKNFSKPKNKYWKSPAWDDDNYNDKIEEIKKKEWTIDLR